MDYKYVWVMKEKKTNGRVNEMFVAIKKLLRIDM